MIVSQPLEASVIGVGDNYIVLSEVDSYVDVTYTVRGTITEVFELCHTANNGIVELNIREITRLVYDNLENYEDPFDYTADVLYTEVDSYHFIKVDISITDANLDTVLINDISVVNASLDVGECLLLTALDGVLLNELAGKNQELIDALNFDLNHNLH